MVNQLTTHKIAQRIRRTNRRLNETRSDPRNADRALCGVLAVVSFAGATGHNQNMQAEPETVLVDLLADLMHWCDTQKGSAAPEGSINFESALECARNHYREEYDDEQEQLHVERG
jgi:hypothetical protein